MARRFLLTAGWSGWTFAVLAVAVSWDAAWIMPGLLGICLVLWAGELKKEATA